MVVAANFDAILWRNDVNSSYLFSDDEDGDREAVEDDDSRDEESSSVDKKVALSFISGKSDVDDTVVVVLVLALPFDDMVVVMAVHRKSKEEW